MKGIWRYFLHGLLHMTKNKEKGQHPTLSLSRRLLGCISQPFNREILQYGRNSTRISQESGGMQLHSMQQKIHSKEIDLSTADITKDSKRPSSWNTITRPLNGNIITITLWMEISPFQSTRTQCGYILV